MLPNKKLSFSLLSCMVILSMTFSLVKAETVSASTNQPSQDNLKRVTNPSTGKLTFLSSDSTQPASAQALGVKPFSASIELLPSRASSKFDPAMSLIEHFGAEFGILNPAQELKVMRTDHPSGNRVVTHYQQMYKGLPVLAGELIVNTNTNGDLYSIGGKVSPNLSLSITPTISTDDAQKAALEAVGQAYQKSASDLKASAPALWIFDEGLLRSDSMSAPELTWRMDVTPSKGGGPINELVLVNAMNGEVSLHFNQVDTYLPTQSNVQEAAVTVKDTTRDMRPAISASITKTEPAPIQRVGRADPSGTSRYVATTGSNTSDCTVLLNPCLTINYAIGQAIDGDTVYVEVGTYTGSGTSPVVTIEKSITLSGGWDASFSTQNDLSIIDGQNARGGLTSNVNCSNSIIIIDHFRIQNGYTGTGAGIYDCASLTLNNSVVSQNTPTTNAGGVYASGTLTLNDSLVENNGKGGIEIYGNKPLTINNSTITGNQGSGILLDINNNYSAQATTILNSTISKNTASGIQISYSYWGRTVIIKNSILAGNATKSGGSDCSGTINTSDHNIIGNSSGCTLTTSSGDQLNTDPMLSNYTIGNPGYYVLLSGSPAIDAGNPATCLSTDQRGLPRTQGSACDIGAYEYVPTPGSAAIVGITSGSNQHTTPNTPFATPLIAYVTDSQGSPIENATVTLTAPSSGPSGTFADSKTNTTWMLTDNSGIASFPTFTANSELGSYNVEASVAGLPVAEFALSNLKWFVATTGNNSNTCDTAASPCQTINGALNKAQTQNGDIILVASGTYTDIPGYVVSITKNVSIYGGWDSTFSTQSGFSTVDGQNKYSDISVNTTGNVLLDHFSVYNGNTTYNGGGVYILSGSISIENSTISHNSSGIYGNGGGIYISGSSSLNLNNSTVTANSATNSGGGLFDTTTGTITLNNTILAGNTAASTGPDCKGTINIFDHSIIGDTSGCTVSAIATNPQLSPYPIGAGGYYPLLSSSPAIDAGSPPTCLSTDQRGVSRPQGSACDIGAYEYVPSGSAFSTGISDGNGQTARNYTAFTKPLVAYVVDNQGSPVSGIAVTFTAPTSGPSGSFSDSGTNTTTATTDVNGIAISAAFTANSRAGTYAVNATAAGLGGSSIFTLANTGWFVSPTGSDSNSCAAEASPCLTIQGAINKSGIKSGDTIYIATGSYTYSDPNYYVVYIPSNLTLTLSGGWDNTFTTQNGFSFIDGQYKYPGVFNSGNATLDHFQIQNGNPNYDVGGGSVGGIYSEGSLFLNNSAVIDNSGEGVSSGNLTLNNSTVQGNSGIGIAANTLTLNNSTITGNQGGGLSVGGGTITNSTITKNTIPAGKGPGGGIKILASGTLTIMNSIIAGNTADSGSDCSGTISTSDHNLIGNISGCTLTTSTGDQLNKNPLISSYSIGNPGYHALLNGSPAIDAGNPATCLPIDERGMSRPQGSACDIGAYEYVPSGAAGSIGTSDGNLQMTGINLTFAKPLVAYVVDSQGNPVSGIPVTFTAPPSGPSGTFANGTNTTSAATDSSGVAVSTTFTANSQIGSYSVAASASGLSPANFVLSNTVWYVTSKGNDLNNCMTPVTACQTVDGAIVKAPAGGTIFVASVAVQLDLNIRKNLKIYGGWNNTFTAQDGVLGWVGGGNEGQPALTVSPHITATVEGFAFENGGVLNQGNLTLQRVTIYNSKNISYSTSVYGLGGGIFNDVGASLNLINVTVSGNHATKGGGIYINGGTATLNNVTIANNFVTDDQYPTAGGGIYVADGTVTISNSIIAGNNGPVGKDCYGTIHSGGYNIIGDGTDCSFIPTTGDQVGTSKAPIKVLLGQLANDTGTALIHPLLTGSSAIDAGNPDTPGSGGNACAATDQRGVSRPQGTACDIGAYEGSISQTLSPIISIYTEDNFQGFLPGQLCNHLPNCGNYNPDLDAVSVNNLLPQLYNYYLNQAGRHSLDDNNTPLVATVHYGNKYANAFWDGSQVVFGDKYGFANAPDVIAHEFTHGVIQYSSNLLDYYQSGAISESLSDIWGESFKQKNNLGQPDPNWLFGIDVTGLGATRSMSNPPKFGDPDSMTSPLYQTGPDDAGGVHHNNGVNNKAAYLLINGGTFNGKTVSALGIDKTLAIYYEVQTNLLTSGSDYADLYNVLYQGCLDLVGGSKGITSGDCQQVSNARDAVKMNLSPNPTYNPDPAFCPAGTAKANTDLFFDDFEHGISKWQGVLVNDPTGQQAWVLSNIYAASGTYSLHALDGTVVNNGVAMMRSGVYINPKQTYLYFLHAFGFSYNSTNNYNGGVLEYSTDGGKTWIDAKPLFSAGVNYNGVITSSEPMGFNNPLHGRSGFVKESHGYVASRYNITSLAGKSVKFAWHTGTALYGSSLGWVVDDVRIYTCSTPPTPSVPRLLTPTNGSTVKLSKPNLDWTDSTPANDTYEVQVSTSSTFKTLFVDATSLSKSTYTLTKSLSPNTTYYWRVRATNTVKVASLWSAVWHFKTSPTLTMVAPPGDGIASLQVPGWAELIVPDLTGHFNQ